MKFEYNSTRGIKKVLDQEITNDIRRYLNEYNLSTETKMGKLHDLLLNYRTPTGKRLLINQLEPLFTYMAINGRIWPEE